MNKIKIVNDIPKIINIDNTIEFELLEKNDLLSINTLKLNIKKDTSLELNLESIEYTKINIFINVEENVNFSLTEIKKGKEFKSQYKYFINKNSSMQISKYHNIDTIKELININLEGEGASINYNFKTIATNTEKYDLIIYHNNISTISNIKNNGVNIKDGNLIFNVSSFVSHNKKNCDVNQTSRIINLTDNMCQINPNLFIDEYDVCANHSALIGNFRDEEFFYLQSRGIDKKTATKLLIRGFLINDFNSNIVKIIDKNIKEHWR